MARKDPKDKRTLAEKQAEKKADFIKYFEDVPVQKYAAMYIGVTEATVINWMKEDEDFSSAVHQARAKWVKKRTLDVKAEFALERLESSVFKERREMEIKLPEPIISLEEGDQKKVIDV